MFQLNPFQLKKLNPLITFGWISINLICWKRHRLLLFCFCRLFLLVRLRFFFLFSTWKRKNPWLRWNGCCIDVFYKCRCDCARQLEFWNFSLFWMLVALLKVKTGAKQLPKFFVKLKFSWKVRPLFALAVGILSVMCVCARVLTRNFVEMPLKLLSSKFLFSVRVVCYLVVFGNKIQAPPCAYDWVERKNITKLIKIDVQFRR